VLEDCLKTSEWRFNLSQTVSKGTPRKIQSWHWAFCSWKNCRVSERITKVDPPGVPRCIPYPVMVNEEGHNERPNAWQIGRREQVSKMIQFLARRVGISPFSSVDRFVIEFCLNGAGRSFVNLTSLTTFQFFSEWLVRFWQFLLFRIWEWISCIQSNTMAAFVELWPLAHLVSKHEISTCIPPTIFSHSINDLPTSQISFFVHDSQKCPGWFETGLLILCHDWRDTEVMWLKRYFGFGQIFFGF
jgi:hypothetical protein